MDFGLAMASMTFSICARSMFQTGNASAAESALV
jgi:hypothetical protein